MGGSSEPPFIVINVYPSGHGGEMHPFLLLRRPRCPSFETSACLLTSRGSGLTLLIPHAHDEVVVERMSVRRQESVEVCLVAVTKRLRLRLRIDSVPQSCASIRFPALRDSKHDAVFEMAVVLLASCRLFSVDILRRTVANQELAGGEQHQLVHGNVGQQPASIPSGPAVFFEHLKRDLCQRSENGAVTQRA